VADRRRAKGEGSVYQLPNGRWRGAITVGYTETGRQQRKVVSGRTQQEALKKLRAVQRQVDDGLPPSNDMLTMSKLFEMWLAHVKRNLAPSGFDNYEWAVRLHLEPAIGRKRVTKLTTHDVDLLLSRKEGEGLRTSSVLRIRSVLSQALDQAERWGYVHRNVARLSTGPRRETEKRRSLTEDQARRLLGAVQGHRLETLYVLMLTLGLRKSEALGLKWSDFSARAQTLTVERALKYENGKLVLGDVKTKASRRDFILPKELVKSLGSHRARQATEKLRAGEVWQEHGLMFTTEIGTPFDLRNLNRDFDKICESSGLGHWRPHELRHSATSLMLAHGIGLKVVSDVMGHSSIRMTADTYGHTQSSERRQAAATMADVLWGTDEVND
jgi:integrase